MALKLIIQLILCDSEKSKYFEQTDHVKFMDLK